MEYYDWSKNASKASIEAIFGKPSEEIPNIQDYSEKVISLMNEGKILWTRNDIEDIHHSFLGESEYSVSKYGEAVRKILDLPAAASM